MAKGSNKSAPVPSRRKKCGHFIAKYNRCKKLGLSFLKEEHNKNVSKDSEAYKVIDEIQTLINDDKNEGMDTSNHDAILIETNSDEVENICIDNNPDTRKTSENNSLNLNNTDKVDIENSKIIGKRIVDIKHFFHSLQKIGDHSKKFGCSISNLILKKEKFIGLNSLLSFTCNMCQDKFQISTNPLEENNLSNINSLAVEGIMSVGGGFYNIEEVLGSMEIPSMSEYVYKKHHDIVCDAWEKVAQTKMKEAAEKEAKYAIENGNVDKNGTPCITVVADGCWSKRSYQTNYSALSGAAAIVGHQFGEILYLGVKNKYCSICINDSKKENNESTTHTCFKNFVGSSTSMESEILVQGFKESVDTHGIKYTKLIADGDSSTYKKIVEANPYKDTTIEKIECCNHLLRNFCKKLRNLSTDTKFRSSVLKQFIKNNILKFRRAITSAVKFRNSCDGQVIEKIALLKSDIENSVSHIFGEHNKCDAYFCQKAKNANNEDSQFKLLKNSPEMFNRLNYIIRSIALHAKSLLLHLNSNIVEQFHSIVAKFIGGKRINYSKGRSYKSRCLAAVVSFNSKGRAHSELHKTILGKSPSKIKSKFELKRLNKCKRSLQFRKAYKAPNKAIHQISKDYDPDYGLFCQQPDMPEEDYENEKLMVLNGLRKTEEERTIFERSTILQSECVLWVESRRKLLTASHFYDVCSKKKTTHRGNLVKNILYGIPLNTPAVNHGKCYEEVALKQLEAQLKVKINKCGMFIDEKFHYLGATPDGLIGEDRIVEIKCPYSSFNKPVELSIDNKKINFWKNVNGVQEINQKHKWYYQIQGQLHIAKKKKCVFGVWTSSDYELKTEIIFKDDSYWSEKMEEKLCDFYMSCLLPEIIDPRQSRSMKIRDPAHDDQTTKTSITK